MNIHIFNPVASFVKILWFLVKVNRCEMEISYGKYQLKTVENCMLYDVFQRERCHSDSHLPSNFIPKSIFSYITILCIPTFQLCCSQMKTYLQFRQVSLKQIIIFFFPKLKHLANFISVLWWISYRVCGIHEI